MRLVKTMGEVGTGGRLRLDVPVELPVGTSRTSMGTLPAGCTASHWQRTPRAPDFGNLLTGERHARFVVRRHR